MTIQLSVGTCLQGALPIPTKPCHLRSMRPRPMCSLVWSTKDAKFATERIIFPEKISSLVSRKWRPADNQLLQGFLLVITSYSSRDTFLPHYEAESGPLWVNFDRCFPLKAKVNLPSRIESTTWYGFDPWIISAVGQIYSETEELVVRKCRHVDDNCRKLSSLITRSHANGWRTSSIMV